MNEESDASSKSNDNDNNNNNNKPPRRVGVVNSDFGVKAEQHKHRSQGRDGHAFTVLWGRGVLAGLGDV